jgi:hypothetical protein
MRYSWIVGCLVFLAACSAGSAGSGKGSGAGPGNNGGGAAASSGTGTGSGAGANAIGSGTSGTSGGTTGTAGGAGAGSTGNSTGQGEQCSTVGMTRACCGAGNQTCQGTGEFPMWGPCIGTNGLTMTKCTVPSGCGVGENAKSCDAGVRDSGPAGDSAVPSLPPAPKLCTDPTVSTEPQIIAGYSPSGTETVGSNGQIKVWVTDECPPFIATGETVDANTGMITMPGARTGVATDNYLNEPALYIAPQSADNGGTPHFPNYVKGDYNNMPFNFNSNPLAFLSCSSNDKKGPAYDPPPAGAAMLNQAFNAEFVWDVNKLGLAPGSYIAEFSIHDGDRERAIGCVNIVISGTN